MRGLCSRGFWAPEGVAIVIEEPPEGELIERVLRVLGAGGGEGVPGLGAVSAGLVPRGLLIHGVKV